MPPFCRKLCSHCELSVCRDCWGKLRNHDAESSFLDDGTIHMSLSNDHYYGHVNRYIVENNVTWLECAACCTVWSTMLVYASGLVDWVAQVAACPAPSTRGNSKTSSRSTQGRRLSCAWKKFQLSATSIDTCPRFPRPSTLAPGSTTRSSRVCALSRTT